jgi:Tfp pilus assembly protein PilO
MVSVTKAVSYVSDFALHQMNPWRFFKVKMLLVVFMVFLAGYATYWCVSKSMAEAAREKEENAGKAEHV